MTKPIPTTIPPTTNGTSQVALAAWSAMTLNSVQPAAEASSTTVIAVTTAVNMTLKTLRSYP
jgi:hypothetical protein